MNFILQISKLSKLIRYPLVHILKHVDRIRVSFNTHSNACGLYTSFH